MADIADKADDQSEFIVSAMIASCSKPFQVGVAGECNRCGDESKRLINGVCATCRDKYKLA